MKLGHYTNTQGLMGIFQSKTLRATNIKFLNDEHEFVHALELIRQLILSTDDHKAKPHVNEFKEFKEKILSKINTLDQYTVETIYTLSFSEKTDLLSQWRGYCPNNDGYCLFIETQNILDSAKESYDECHFYKCIYSDEEKENTFRQLLNSYWSKYWRGNKELRLKVIEDFRTDILLLASHFKNSAFQEESEHRIVVLLPTTPDKRIKFRQGQFSVVPYVEIEISDLESIERIIIGPTHRKELAQRGLRCLLESAHDLPDFLINTNIELSDIPYRS
jgi:hypothetical protein